MKIVLWNDINNNSYAYNMERYDLPFKHDLGYRSGKLFKVGNDVGCLFFLDRKWRAEGKLAFLEAFSKELKTRGMSVDATVIADSDCSMDWDFPKFHQGVKKIDRNIATVETHLYRHKKPSADHLFQDDLASGLIPLLQKRETNNYPLEEACDKVLAAYKAALLAIGPSRSP
jgi:hypothetical protein